MRRVELYDTTLRDGAQTEGVSYSAKDKLLIAEKLDELGIHYIEGGWPGSNPKDIEFFKQVKKLKLKKSIIVAFGSTRRANSKARQDLNIKALLKAKTEIVTIFGKSWDLHVKDVLKSSLGENLYMIFDTVKYLKARGLDVFYDAEHFFDGYKSNPAYALETILAAQEAGCEAIILCDTNGGMITSETRRIIDEIKPKVKIPLGIHAHNDTAMAVASTIVAVESGCSQVQGTINGYGERCGNADLISIIANLKLKLGINCISESKLKELTEVSRFISEVSNMKQQDNQSFVGKSAFAHKGGVHINAVMKNPLTYEHVKPHWVGNKRRILVSELSGKAAILIKAKEFNLGLNKNAAQTKKVLKLLQDLEHQGYQFEAAEASFELLMKRALKKYKKFFTLEDFRIIVEKGNDPQTGQPRIFSEATIKIKVNNIEEHTVSVGDGPVNALDNALRKALHDFYPTLSEMHLSDFKVRVLDEKAGTAAKVKVIIQSQDARDSWSTVGVSENIIEASWQALVDSVEYKLLKDKKSAKKIQSFKP